MKETAGLHELHVDLITGKQFGETTRRVSQPGAPVIFDLTYKYLYWQKTCRRILQKINELIKNIQRGPFAGLGKPEKLRFDLSGYWSRRINQEHRLVYRVDAESGRIVIIQCRLHYG